MKKYDDAFRFVVGAEGGYGADPHDRGNWTTGIIGEGELRGTKYGISAMSFPDLDIKGLTVEQAKSIYQQNYWKPMRCLYLSYPKAVCIFDCAVNQGTRRAARLAQKVAGVKVDGIIGNQTLEGLQSISDEVFVCRFLELREEHYRSLRTFDRYGNGWLNRLKHCKKEALGA